MKPNETIDNMIATFPDIFYNAYDCANHLLFTNGNGYHWKNGEIVDKDYDGEKVNNVYDAIDLFFKYNDVCCGIESDELKRLKSEKLCKNIKTIVKYFKYNGDARYNVKIDENTEIHFSDYDLIFHIPDNITKEWRDFCYDALNSLLISNIDLGEFDEKIQEVYNHLVELKTKTITYTFEIDTLVIDCNNIKLYNKLEKLGFKPLSWNTNKTGEPLRLCVANHYYPNIGNFVYWNDGSKIGKFTDYSNILICTDEDEFIDYAKQLINGDRVIKTVTKTIFE